MSDDAQDAERRSLMIMEEEVKIAGAEHAKKAILLRIAKRQSEIKRDEEHLVLQDKAIGQANAEISKLRAANGGT